MIRQIVFAAVLVFVGALAGVIFTVMHYKDYNAAKFGEYLDRDLVVMSDGQARWGNIVMRENGKLMFAEDDQSPVEISEADTKKIFENYYTRYFKNAL